MMLQREGARPLYLQVAQQLEQEIAEGNFLPFSRLMSESGLMRRFEVSRVTVRAAIMLLVQKGLVDVHQGKGTFVSGPTIRQRLDAFSCIHDVLLEQGLTPDRRLLDYRPARHDEVAGTPFAHTGDVPTLLRRLYVLHGKPFAVVEGLLAPGVATLSRSEVTSQTILGMLRLRGGGVARADVAIRARPAPGQILALLGLPRRRVVMLLERTSYDHAGAVLDFSVFHIVPEAWEFGISLPGNPPVTQGRTAGGARIALAP